MDQQQEYISRQYPIPLGEDLQYSEYSLVPEQTLQYNGQYLKSPCKSFEVTPLTGLVSVASAFIAMYFISKILQEDGSDQRALIQNSKTKDGNK